MSDTSAAVSDSDKKNAVQWMLIGGIVMAVMGVLAFLLGAAVYGIIDFALAGAVGYFARTRALAGDYGTAKIVTLISAAIIALLGLMALTAAGAGGGLGLLVAIVVLGTAGLLIYASMLISPGRKLF